MASQQLVRQRGGATTRAAAAAAAEAEREQQPQSAGDEELSTSDRLVFYAAQHIGLVLCVAGVALLAAGYDRGWMDNARLSLASLALCLVGLFFHEFRPFQ